MQLVNPLKLLTFQFSVLALLACSCGPRCTAETPVELKLASEQGRPQSVAFDSELSRLAVLQPSGDVDFHDLHSGRKLHTWKTGWTQDPGTDFVPVSWRRLQFLDASRKLLVASGSHIGVFDVADGTLVRELALPDVGVGNLCVSRDSKRVLAQCGNAMIAWDLESGKSLFNHKSTGYRVVRRDKYGLGSPGSQNSMPVTRQMSFHNDGSLVALCLEFEQIDIWNLDGPDHVGTCKGSSPRGGSTSGVTTACGFLPDGRMVGVFNFLNLEVFAADARKGKMILDQVVTKEAQVFEMHALATTVDGKKVALGGIGARGRRSLDPSVTAYDEPAGLEVQVFETDGFTRLSRYQGQVNECVADVAWDAAGKRLAIVSGVGYTDIWSGTLQQTMRRNGGMMAASKLPLRVRVWTP